MICINEEISKKLEGINASLLINNLLVEHFRGNDIQNLAVLKKKFQENKQNLKENKRKDKELRINIKKIETKEKEMLNITGKLMPIERLNNQVLWSKAKELLTERKKMDKKCDVMQIYLELKGGLK